MNYDLFMKWLRVLTLLVFGVVSVQMISAQEAYLVAGQYNQNHPLVAYTGSGWTLSPNAIYRGGNHTFTYNDGDFMQFSCVCDSVTIVYTRCAVCGVMEIFVDGYSTNSFTTEHPTTIGQNTYTISGFASGFHRITIKKGVSFPTPNSQAIGIEGIDVSNSVTGIPTSQPQFEVTVEVVFPEQTPEPEPTVAWRDEYSIFDETGKARSVAFEWKFTAGEVAVSVVLFGVLVVLIAMFARESIGR